jgi:hypothetical protein
MQAVVENGMVSSNVGSAACSRGLSLNTESDVKYTYMCCRNSSRILELRTPSSKIPHVITKFLQKQVSSDATQPKEAAGILD